MSKVKCLMCNELGDEGERCWKCNSPIVVIPEMEKFTDAQGRITTLLVQCPRCGHDQSTVDASYGECAICGFNINVYLGNGMFGKKEGDRIIIDHIPGARIGYTEPMPVSADSQDEYSEEIE